MATATGAASAAAAAGYGAFSYNRASWMFDADMRWERFTTAREYANQQAELYRGDLRTLAALTTKKNGIWATTCTLCMALCVALYCAGRLGLHGPSPPAWIMGLWLTNNAAAFAFMALGTILALQAALRAQASSVQLLTRKTRVPIPTLKELDKARRFASEFEQQDWKDIFRIPYLSNNGAPKTDEAIFDSDQEGGENVGGSSRRSSSMPPGRSKASSWVQQEFDDDRAGWIEPSCLPADAAPEHFRLFAEAQKEFYQQDIYARICVFLGFLHFFQAAAFYGLGHINIELRAFWVPYGIAFIISTLGALILRFDIIPVEGRKHYLPRCEYFGPLAVLPAAIGMSLDFRVQFSTVAVGFTWFFIFLAYIFQLIASLRILEVILPDMAFTSIGERLGASWLPADMDKVPSSFYHVLYFVTAPSKMQPGQNDLVREVKEGGRGATNEVLGISGASQVINDPVKTARDPSRQNAVEPWKVVAAVAAILPASWIFLMIGNIVDLALGEQGLLTAPHWSRPPMTRLSREPHELGTPIGFPWRAGGKPWIPEQMAWHEEKRHADQYLLGERRLSANAQPSQASTRLFSEALHGLFDTLPSIGQQAGMTHRRHSVEWPNFFEPRLLACGAGGSVAAITPRGFGALTTIADQHTVAESFRLAGLPSGSPIIGASFSKHFGTEEGLLLISKVGELLACPGPRPASGKRWSCNPISKHFPDLPQSVLLPEGSNFQAATASIINGILHAAVSFAENPSNVDIFAWDQGSWTPKGDMRLPPGDKAGKLTLSFTDGGDIVIATGDGHLVRRDLRDGSIVAAARHHLGNGDNAVSWQGACAVESDGIAHLRLRRPSTQPSAVFGWQPEILSSKVFAASTPGTKGSTSKRAWA